MTLTQIAILTIGGLSSGVLAGFLGIGGGVMLVPLFVQLGFEPIQATATSSLAIFLTSTIGSFQNWRMGYLNLQRVLLLCTPALITALIGTQVADKLPNYVLLTAFGLLLLANLYLAGLKKRVASQRSHLNPPSKKQINPLTARLMTGGIAGFMAGLFGVGGGVVLVPLQILLLNEPIKAAVRTSLGVIVITAISACVSHSFNGNVVWVAGLLVGCGGLVGVQASTRFLPKLKDRTISLLFRTMLCFLAANIFWQAWRAWQI